MYFDEDAYGYFDGEISSQHTTVCVTDDCGRTLCRGLERHEVREYLYRHLSVRTMPHKRRIRTSRDIDRLDYALTNRKHEQQIMCEMRLGIRVLVKSRGEMCL